MKQLPLPYRITKPPAAIKRARLDNIVLVPASLLPLKDTYQPIANNLPQGSVLIYKTGKRQQIQTILINVAAFFRSKGRKVILGSGTNEQDMVDYES